MNEKLFEIGQKLIDTGKLTTTEYKYLIDNRNEEITELLKNEAVKKRKEVYGNTVFIRGLIEISNICKNDCLYCGIRASNKECDRYRLTKEEILSCCDEGYSLGFRTFVMQGGEDLHFTDELLCDIIGEIKKKYPDCAVTLSLGERSYESYKKLYNVGADRYLLRHETADEEHYSKLHPEKMSYKTRMECLKNLKEIGFQTGCGFMVGSPYQTTENLAKDLKFIEEFSPQMCGIGPFIPHKATQFHDCPSGDVELTCYLLSIIRLIKPTILLPATTALGSAEQGGREKGILCGANVIMPNLSPHSVRKKYELYNNKLISGNESAQEIENLKNSMKNIGYKIVTDRGDIKEK
ncbi:MAG: [Clostridia bacterium]|nr:[FeFe] hydrogenase H-cluster radical SAM maturase HydE [Clostridia bacterium]